MFILGELKAIATYFIEYGILYIFAYVFRACDFHRLGKREPFSLTLREGLRDKINFYQIESRRRFSRL